MLVSERYSHDEAGALSLGIVLDVDCAVMKLYKRTCEVESHAGASCLIVAHLIETLEYVLSFRFGYAYTRVGDADFSISVQRPGGVVVGSRCQLYVDFTAVGSVFHCIRQQVHDDFVEVGRVDPQLHVVMSLVVKCQGDVLAVGYGLE